MKKLLFFVISLMVASACSTTKEAKTARAEQKELKQEIVKQAVESRRYIVKLDRFYLNAGFVDLIDRKNYIIIDGKKAVLVAAYFGRQYDVKPIAGINIHGVANKYQLTSNQEKGRYEVDMRIENGIASFNVNLTIHNNGNCDAYVNGLKINGARYSGYMVPIGVKPSVPLQPNNDVI